MVCLCLLSHVFYSFLFLGKDKYCTNSRTLGNVYDVTEFLDGAFVLFLAFIRADNSCAQSTLVGPHD